MLTPLTQYFCDTCGQVINNPNEGWIEWLSEYNEETGKEENYGFKIVHHLKYSPLANEHRKRGCYQYDNGAATWHLHQFIEDNYKMAHILGLLDIGPYHQKEYKGPTVKDMREYVEFVRRLTIPHYEEARKYWDEAVRDGYFGDSNEVRIYGADFLQGLIERYER